MPSKFEEVIEEPKDRTKLVWIGITCMFVLMVAALWLSGRQTSNMTMVGASHILIRYDASDPSDRQRALKLITELRDRILAGEKFARLAKEHSDDPGSAAHGGYLGMSPRDTYVDEFEEYVWSAPMNQLSEVISTSHGFHLIVVKERTLSEADKYELELDQRVKEKDKIQGTAAN
jgi:parvulin-like peptidyl-prolyl isomerase